jgi:perosamine synthetase
MHRIQGGCPLGVGFPAFQQKRDGNTLGFLDQEIQSFKPEHAALLELSRIRLQKRVFRFRLRPLHSGRTHVQIQRAMGRDADSIELALLAEGWQIHPGDFPCQSKVRVGDQDLEKTSIAGDAYSWPAHCKESSLKIRRTIPPAAAPFRVSELIHGIGGMFSSRIAAKTEQELKEYFGVKHVYLVSSGKTALAVILSALKKLRNRSHVIIPAYTCYSVPSAIMKAGLKIRLCDINPDTLDYDYEMLDKIVDDDVLGIVSTHLFGIPSEVSELKKKYGNRGIFIIEDAAQAMGGISQRKKLGTLGDAGFFSLGRGKNITAGTGGIILTSSDDLADAINDIFQCLKEEPHVEYVKNIIQVFFQQLFIHPNLYWFPFQLPFLKIGETIYCTDFSMYRLSNFKIGLMHQWRSRLERFNDKRSRTGNYYANNIMKSENIRIHSGAYPYLRFPVYLGCSEEKARICKEYSWLGISPMYPDSVNHIEEIKDDFSGSVYPGADYVVRRLITLPTHCFLNERDKSSIASILKGL